MNETQPHAAPRALTAKQQAYFDRSQRMSARHPGGARFFSRANRFVFALSRGRIGNSMQGVPIGLLQTTGRRSGRSHTVPVVYLDDGSRFLVVASNSGFNSAPAWQLNLRADPNAQMRTRSGAERVAAREVTGQERAELWPRLVDRNPMWGAYQTCTDRQLAVVALERQETASSEAVGTQSA